MLLIILFLHSEPDSNQYQRFWRPGCCHYTIGVFLLIHQDSNLNSKNQNLGCCQLHYGSVLRCFVEQTGIEPVPLVFQTNVHTLYTTLPGFVMGNR